MTRTIAVLAVAAVLAGCGAAARTTPPEATTGTGQQAAGNAAGEGIEAVAAVWPLASVAQEVAPGAEVTLLNAGGAEAHDIEITPAQRAAIETADVVLYMGDIDYQPQVEQAIAAARGEIVDVAALAGEERLLGASADAHADEGDDHADEQSEVEAEDGHADEGESAVDPHLWFDMEVMADVATATADALATADSQRAQEYTTNAEELADEFADVDGELDASLGGDCEFDEAIISHVAYAYLTQPRDKELHGITGIDPEAGASAAALAALVTEVREEGFRYIVAEPVEGRADAEALAREADVELLDIYPLDAVTDDQAGMPLPDLVRQQAQTLATAYGCP